MEGLVTNIIYGHSLPSKSLELGNMKLKMHSLGTLQWQFLFTFSAKIMVAGGGLG